MKLLIYVQTKTAILLHIAACAEDRWDKKMKNSNEEHTRYERLLDVKICTLLETTK